MEGRDAALEARLKEQFQGCCFGGNIHAFAVCDSTMERAHALARDGGRRSSDRRHSLAGGDRAGSVAGEGTLVFAAKQTNGRGRLGRHWESPAGGAYFSLILKPMRPVAEAPQLSLVAGLSAAEAIHEQVGRVLPLRPPAVLAAPQPIARRRLRTAGGPGSASPAPSCSISIRWPNDVLLNGKKVAGILTEAKNGAVIVGIGINVTTDPKDLPDTATSLAASGAACDPYHLTAALCRKFDGWYDIWTAQGFAPIRESLRPWMSHVGGLVRLTTGASYVEGQAMDVDEQGRLLVRLDSGVIRAFEAGEVTLLR